eukprot:COSAG06_NODE_24854_length_650_cov_13253.529946_1_plen_58_part_10
MLMDLHVARCRQALRREPGYLFSAADCILMLPSMDPVSSAGVTGGETRGDSSWSRRER